MSARETDEWMSRATTPETRASIRRWSRRSDFFFWVGLLLVLGGIAFIVWSVVTERHSGPVFWLVIGVTVVLVLACVAFGSYAGGRLFEARFADGRESVGRVDEVITYTSGEAPDNYDIVVSAVLPGSVTIRRKIELGAAGHLDDDDVGRAVRFRHNTLDPDDLDDVRFEGWQGPPPHRSTPRQSRALYADAHVSVGRVDEVMSHPGIPGAGNYQTYSLMVSVELPGPVTLRRTVYVGEERLRSPGRRFGRAIRVRHNTLDPENLSDAFFDGWQDEVKGG